MPEDELVPYRHMQEYVGRLPAGKLVTLDSIYGHDAFLKEGEALKPIIAEEIDNAFRLYIGNSVELGKQNAQLQADFPDVHDMAT